MLTYCNNCGHKASKVCFRCGATAYCSEYCRLEDLDYHGPNCVPYVQRTLMNKIIESAAFSDIHLLFEHSKFARLIRALHSAWDPFCTGHIKCTIQRRSYDVPNPLGTGIYINCAILYVSGLTNSNKCIRTIKLRYIYDYSYTLRKDISFDTRLCDKSYAELCGSSVLDIPPTANVAVNVLPATQLYVLVVDGNLYRMQ